MSSPPVMLRNTVRDTAMNSDAGMPLPDTSATVIDKRCLVRPGRNRRNRRRSRAPGASRHAGRSAARRPHAATAAAGSRIGSAAAASISSCRRCLFCNSAAMPRRRARSWRARPDGAAGRRSSPGRTRRDPARSPHKSGRRASGSCRAGGGQARVMIETPSDGDCAARLSRLSRSMRR